MNRLPRHWNGGACRAGALMACVGWFTAHSLDALEVRFDTEAELSTNFTPNSGLRWNWMDPAGLDGGGLKLNTSAPGSSSTFTFTGATIPVPRQGDRVWASVDLIFDTTTATNLSPVLTLFLAKESQAADVFNAGGNAFVHLTIAGTYGGSPADGYLVFVESAPQNYLTAADSPLASLEIPGQYRLTLTLDLTAMAAGGHQLTGRLTGAAIPGGIEVTTTEVPHPSNVTDPNWRLGIRSNTNAVTVLDNFRVAYLAGGSNAGIQMTRSVVEGDGFRLDWFAPPGVAVDIYRSTDLFVWGSPIAAGSMAGTFLDSPRPAERGFYALVSAGTTFPEHPVLPGVDTTSWDGVTAGHVVFDPALGYRFTPLPGGLIYPQQDDTVEGGYRFLDSRGVEILMQVPASLNVGYTAPTSFDFRVDSAALASTNYQMFDPSAVVGAVPDLSATTTMAWNAATPGWGLIPLPVSLQLKSSTAAANPGAVWAFATGDVDSPYLLLRQPIPLGAGGLLGSPQPVMLSGTATTDVSLFLRRADGTVVALFEDSHAGANGFAAQLDPGDLQPGINHLEIYASYGVAGPVESPPFQEDFDSLALGSAAGQLPQLQFAGTPWSVSDGSSVNAPAALGQVLAFEGTAGWVDVAGSGTGYPDMIFASVVGKPATDDDVVRLWFRAKTTASLVTEGWFVFLAGSATGSSGVGGAHVGIGYRAANGGDTIVASDLDTPALSAWHASHGFRDAVAEHWIVSIETQDETIRVQLSNRGTPSAAADAGSLAQVLEITDPHFSLATIGALRSFVLEGDSQPCWFDQIETRQSTYRGGLRIDAGQIASLQSLDSLVSVPRYVLLNGQLMDRFGDGTPSSSASPATVSDGTGNWIDYVPSTPLGVAPESEILGAMP
ncbi:MAG: hypothetical protein R3F13_08465 [Prosthecobacter sp.]